MTFALTSSGLTIETLDEAVNRLSQSIGEALGLTAEQTERMRASPQSNLGNLVRIIAEESVNVQEVSLELWNALGIDSEGTQLDRAVALLGVTRRAALSSRVLGTVSGTIGASLANGVRYRYDADSTVWTVADGPYTVGAGGTVADVALVASTADAISVALPSTGWTLLDSAPGIDSYQSDSQPIVGTAADLDAALRMRAGVEAYSRGTGPIRAIEAAVSQVAGVTFVRCWENQTLLTDSDGLPGKSINVVVEGGDSTQIAQAIADSRAGGLETYAAAGSTFESVTLTSSGGHPFTISFNRIETVDIWIDVVLTTSTSEGVAPSGLVDTVRALMVEQAAAVFGAPGDDILPWALEGVVYAQGYPGLDNVTVTVGLSGGGGLGAAKVPISIRQKGVYDLARTTASEA